MLCSVARPGKPLEISENMDMRTETETGTENKNNNEDGNEEKMKTVTETVTKAATSTESNETSGGTSKPEKPPKHRHPMRILAVILLVLLLGGDLFVSNYLVSFALERASASGADVAPKPNTSAETKTAVASSRTVISEQTAAWLESAPRETVEIRSADGLRLAADLFPTETDSHRWLIAVHGYTGRRRDMYSYAAFYAVRGYSVLTPDLRAHGESEGRYIGMGWPDRKDMLQWIGLILERDPSAEIVLHGVSMGGGTVMKTAGEALPPNVIAIVDDCGYTSVWDVFSDELAYLFHLPEFPVLYTADGIAKLRAGYGFHEASALEQVKKATVPMLFLHGSKDNFVHTEMVYRLYDACPTEKELYVAEGAGHGQSLYVDPEAYFDCVFSFLDRVSPE